MENEKMFTSERFQRITDYLKEHSRARIEELAQLLYVSPATIRRDLTEMQNLGLIQRTHGGAVYLETADEVSIYARIAKNAKDKEATVSLSLDKLPSFQSVFIDNSSTVLALAQRLDLSHKIVVTNGIEAAMSLAKKKDVTIYLLGGEILTNTNSTQGEATIEMLHKFHLDLMLCSCAAIKEDGSYEHSLSSSEVKRAAFRESQIHILLADVHKFEETGIYRSQELSDYDAIYTNAPDSVIGKWAHRPSNLFNH
jgi:Transcriptional regulators of sugar metabolism